MKRYISKKERKHYTYMLEIINAIGGRNLKYNWLITEIETNLSDNSELERLIEYKEYVFLSNDELLNILEKEDFQWMWGIFFCYSNRLF